MKYSQQVLRTDIEKVVAQGQGLARTSQGVVLLPGVLPGETVDYRLEENTGKGVLRGQVVQILSPSPGRREAFCPLYGLCGGCDLMHAIPTLQADIKKSIFLDAMTRQGKEEIKPFLELLSALPLVQGEESGYRSRFRFHRGPQGRPALAQRNSRQVMELDDCPVAHPLIRAWLQGKPVLPRASAGFPGRSGKPGMSGSTGGSGSPRRPGGSNRSSGPSDLADQDQETGSGFPDDFRVFASQAGLFLDQDECRAPVLDQEFRFGQKAFFQSNLAMLEALLTWLRPRLEDWMAGSGATRSGEMADLYGGVGTFSRFMPDSGRLWLVEENKDACAAARLAMKDRKNLHIHSGDVDTWLARAGTLDLVVVDPPRTGLSSRLIDRLGRQKPGLLVYVSCDPVTLARDARRLAGSGFRITDGALFDFYPQTWHLESVVLFMPEGRQG